MVTNSSVDRPWVLGIRPKATVWYRRVQSLLLSTFPSDIAGVSTAAAENGLGLSPSLYWYVLRTEEHYGHVVFLWSEREAFLPEDGAVSPFDTGGLWHGHVATDPAVEPDDRKEFVAANSVPVSDWLVAFQSWIRANYARTAEYVEGQPPNVGVARIVYDSRNSAPAWTWEARVEKGRYRQQVAIRHVFWSADDRKAFEDWVEERSGVDDKLAEDLLELVAAVTVETPRVVRANEEVVRHLLRLVEDD